MEGKIVEILQKAIREMAEEEFEKAKEQMIERLDRNKDQILAGITLSIFKNVLIDRFGEEIRISLKTESIKE